MNSSIITFLLLISIGLSVLLILFVVRSLTQFRSTIIELAQKERQDLGDRLHLIFDGQRTATDAQLALNRQELKEELALNRKELREGLTLSTKELELKFTALESKVNLRLEAIGQNVQTKLEANIQEGFKHFQLITETLTNAEKQLSQLNVVGQSVNELNNLLKLPHLRGGFGEATLERLLNDFLPAGTFELQHEIVPHSHERVDAVVLFPSVKLPIDSKFPREQVLPLFESANDAERLSAARKTLTEVIKGQARSIESKYLKPEHGTTELALMFLPSETLYFEVIRDVELWEWLAKIKVFPVSPNTLSISLQFIGRSMHYYEAAQNVKKLILDLGKARKHFENFQKKFEDIGKGLERAQDAFSVATRHLGTYRGSVNRLSDEIDEEHPPESLLEQ